MAEHAEDSEQDDAAVQTPPNGLAEERARFEKERMNRRAALRRFGIGAGATAFLALGVDDLARLVLGKMQERHMMDGVTEQVARELHNAGVSFATAPVECSHCDRQVCQDADDSVALYKACLKEGRSQAVCDQERIDRANDNAYNFVQCRDAHCPKGHPFPDCDALATNP